MSLAQLEFANLPSSKDGNLVIQLNGKLSLESVHSFIQTIRPEPAAHLVLDMSGVTFLDSAGVGALVSIFVSRRNTGKSLALAGLTKQGNAVMEVAGLTKLIPTFPTVDAAFNPTN